MKKIAMHANSVIRSMRLPFLLLTPVCVLLGASPSLASGSMESWGLFTLILLGATLAHLGVNTLNEYQDFRSGLDLNTQRTPFSGGSGALPDTPEAANSVLFTSILALVGTMTIGAYFLWSRGLDVLPFGLIGLVLIIAYTNWVNRQPLLCLISPGLGFGLLMVVGTHVVLGGGTDLQVWILALTPFFLVNNLLLLNQFPDREADKAVGRRHLLIAYGSRIASNTYALFAVGAALSILIPVISGLLPKLALMALIPLPLAVFAWNGAHRLGENIGQQPQRLAANVALTLSTPPLLSLGVIIG